MLDEDLVRLTDAELYRLRTHWVRRLPSDLAIERVSTIDEVLTSRHRGERTRVGLASAGLELTGSLDREIELACYGAQLAWRALDGHISRAGVACVLEKTETGKLLATLSRDGMEPTRRVFARRFDAKHSWEEVGSGHGRAEPKLFDDRSLATELAAWCRSSRASE